MSFGNSQNLLVLLSASSLCTPDTWFSSFISFFFIQLLFQPAGMSPAISRLTAYNLVIVRALALFLWRSGGSVYAEMTEQN